MKLQDVFDTLHIVLSEDNNTDLVAELALDILDTLEATYNTTTDKHTIEKAATSHGLVKKAENSQDNTTKGTHA